MPLWLRIAAVAALLGLAAVGSLLTPYQTELLTQMLIYGLFAMSLDLLVGYTGLPSLGHSAYFGAAAYGAALLSLKLSAPFWLAAPLGLLVAVALAALFNLLALRTAHAYYLMITLALSQVLWSLAVSWSDFTGGDNGLPGVPRPELGISLASPWRYLCFVLVVFGLAAAALSTLVRSPFGDALRGIRENEPRMRALGYPTWRYKFAASLIAAFFAGVAGELFLYLNAFVGPSALGVVLSAQVLLMILMGAAGTLAGPVFGAAVFVVLQNVVSSYTERWLFIVGAIYVLIALYAPSGALVWIGTRWRRRRAARP
jgi:branched-chain amino acid transport system permease protein